MVSDLTAELVADWMQAPNSRGGEIPAPNYQRQRRWAARLFFWALRQVGVDCSDPTIDLPIPKVYAKQFVPLTDRDIAVARVFVTARHGREKWAVIWALAEVGGTASEIARVQADHVDLDNRRVYFAGVSHYRPRWRALDQWQFEQVARWMLQRDPEGPANILQLDDSTEASKHYPQSRMTTIMAGSGIKAAGEKRPFSIRSWLGRRIFRETGRIDEVANALGLYSIDDAASLIGWTWRREEGAA
jgi:integrase